MTMNTVDDYSDRYGGTEVHVVDKLKAPCNARCVSAPNVDDWCASVSVLVVYIVEGRWYTGPISGAF